ncbi:glycine--tRNA ligase subunit beta [Coxiella endosymbiont of Amblyomma americanum]|uniref:glycine--tRNA ligase subunit beta n=1 Tax=Coxiella endosymbiont of Amblyomma americanum TaxID=325775 RepID=UPI00057DC181|nr:glycine--tRNA ligase subunit beta [Coxiella endosymbiont of Amblyomma americanum]AJC50152.1 glycine-tRNA synthetase subunit beta [Coxiella endosymbiont of Amblyomma americanum]AUJ58512.1 glycine--tRNA ligase subunit beta [Coxiella-like endosymbiont of Amblyomma americanum]
MVTKDFLLEIGCEELPPHILEVLSRSLSQNVKREIEKFMLSFESIHHYATPRRLAILVNKLTSRQNSSTVERIGPNVKLAFKKDGTPTTACLGFARSCGVPINQLQTKKTEQGTFVVWHMAQPNKTTYELLPKIIQSTIKNLAISRTMRWGKNSEYFVRPVHWIMVLLGREVVPVSIFGHVATCNTFGHRFHYPHAISITQPRDYQRLLNRRMVIVDFNKRCEKIRELVKKSASLKGEAIVDEKLLKEVTGMVEWPTALLGHFKIEFLKLPPEILVTTMQVYQRCFPIKNEKGNLLPYFVLISNIESKDPKCVISGNERVINSRLSDAAFFYHNDFKILPKDRLSKLSGIIFQKQLGTLLEKTTRISKLSVLIANKIAANEELTKRAALLSKCDLVSKTVCEFPNLRGVMGYYYALYNKETKTVAQAIRDHYLPRSSKDNLPKNLEGTCIALADRLDTLIGIIGINKCPAGNKDPFALRRVAFGIVRLLIEKRLPLSLLMLLRRTEENYNDLLPNKNVTIWSFNFIIERLRSWYLEKNVPSNILSAVLSIRCTTLLDFDLRIKALQYFQTLPGANILTTIHKRVSNILKNTSVRITIDQIDLSAFDSDADRKLVEELKIHIQSVNNLYKETHYKKALLELIQLKDLIHAFFNNVMIMIDDKKRRDNRLAILIALKQLFMKIADFSLLS